MNAQERRPGFTLIELLVSVAIIAMLLGLLLPSLAVARGQGRTAVCLAQLRQLGAAWALYAQDHGGLAAPATYSRAGLAPAGEQPWWFGSIHLADKTLDPEGGFLGPYLADRAREDSALECPAMPWGAYATPDTVAGPTTTYGYNAYYLTPPTTPGYDAVIGTQRWKAIADIERPSELLVFADAALERVIGARRDLKATPLLDPPQLFRSDGSWAPNRAPTTAFRHDHAACGVHADGSALAQRARPAWLVHPNGTAGSVGGANDPAYVPDWRRWR